MLTEKQRCYATLIAGLSLALFGLFYGIFCEKFFYMLMEKDMVLRPGSKMFELWKKPPLKITLDIYMFNWTNPEDFQNLNIKPRFEELGPYSFTELPSKVDISWHPENASITYRKRSKYYFDAANSKGSLEDKIVTINSLAVSVSAKAKRWSPLRRRVIDIALNVYNDDIKMKKTVDELLFGGYEDVLLNVASFIPSSIIDVKVPFDRFGYCYPRNKSADVTGIYNMHTGADDIRKLGQMHTWNYATESPAFAPSCAKIYGSPGEFQTPYLQPHQPVNYFLSDLCRSVKLDYVQPVEVEGVPGFRYEGGLRMIDNGTLYPENVCHCNGECAPMGVINISSCWFGSPMFLSYPHFHMADPYFLEQVEGLQPEAKKHELYIVLEPTTGLMMELAGRLQSNILVEPISDFSLFRNKRKLYFPLFWFEARTRISPDLANEFKLLPRLITSSRIFGGLCMLIGLLMVVWRPLATHFRQRLMQQIKINNLENEQHHITGKDIAAAPEISPLLIRAVQENVRMLDRADTTISVLSVLSVESCYISELSSGERSSLQSSSSSS